MGAPKYDAPKLAPLPVVINDVALIKDSLEASGFEIEVIGLIPEAPMTRTMALRKAGHFSRSAQEGDTLILYYSGHGAHRAGVDYIVPADAVLDDPAMFAEFLVPLDFFMRSKIARPTPS